jgi:hypothetical protein
LLVELFESNTQSILIYLFWFRQTTEITAHLPLLWLLYAVQLVQKAFSESELFLAALQCSGLCQQICELYTWENHLSGHQTKSNFLVKLSASTSETVLLV